MAGYTSLIFYWLGFEYLHMNWSINWPWLNLGNVFADSVWMVQWYEYFGSPGGSLWILLINLFIFNFLKEGFAGRWRFGFRRISLSAILIVFPLIWSLTRFNSYQEVGTPVEVVCVQPNLDPYEQKFVGDPISHLQRMLELMDEVDSDTTRFYLFPETALQEHGPVYVSDDGEIIYRGLWEGNYQRTQSIVLLQNFLRGKNAVAVAGAADRKLYKEKETSSGRYYQSIDMYYDSYNSTLLVDENGVQDWYRKSKLVPGTESIPFSEALSFLEKWSLEIGGTSGSLGTQKGRDPFEYDGMKVAGNICYESVFGEFTSLFVRNGAQALFVSSNDAWWQSSPGHKQLMLYCKLRAIECRKNIARSANTGISCFVDQRGVITSQSEWLEETAIRGQVNLNDQQTFYIEHGDFISRVSCLFAVLLMLWSLVKPLRDKFQK